MIRGQASITVSALAANASEVYTITADSGKYMNCPELADSGKPQGSTAGTTVPGTLLADVIVINPLSTSTYQPEAGWVIGHAWVSARNEIKFRATNSSSGSLSGGTMIIMWAAIR